MMAMQNAAIIKAWLDLCGTNCDGCAVRIVHNVDDGQCQLHLTRDKWASLEVVTMPKHFRRMGMQDIKAEYLKPALAKMDYKARREAKAD